MNELIFCGIGSALETDFNVKIDFKEDNNLHIENFKIERV